jgi:hypothetical protein
MTRSPLDRREFFHNVGHSALALGAVACATPLAFAVDAPLAAPSAPESLVKLLFDSLTPGQRERVCFAWDHQHPEWGLLRTRVSANWNITDEVVDSKFYTPEQQELVHAIYRGIIAPEWHERYDQQQDDDAGGFGANNSIAIFGTPGDGPSELVLTGRHMTLRCDGNSAEHVAFGGPIFYGHDPTGTQDDDAKHEGSVFWSQALEANSLYQALDGKQQQLALVKRLPSESQVAFRGTNGQFDGIPLTEFSADQKARVQEVLRKLIEPFRQSDRDEALACLTAQGGLDACSLAFYQPGDIGNDKVWDNWRLEGPSFVWHFRGSPHVHTWVNIADNPSVKLNA